MDFQVQKKTVALHFGFDFMEAINQLSGISNSGVNLGMGAMTEQQRLEMGDMAALTRVIYAATAGVSPRPSLDLIKSEVFSLTDEKQVDDLFAQVQEELKNSFPLQYQLKKMEKLAAKNKL
ncbi:tail assembly chaperone [Lacticaseibacillus mingshuiensis]|uniref:tail assembly chaperone n=1 Tax=Lacticaseibacillus mingshuiensis TaxID=2799574 RepID=UPI00194DCEC8|nr:tail assembly chaperone [Lacticaseibacillus mingshuiensis]